MKRAVVLIAIAALLVCIIPMADSSDAAGETTISGYIKGGDVSSSTNITISIFYSDVIGSGEAVLVNTVKEVSPPDASGKNKFSIPLTVGTKSTDFEHYYIYINILGYKVTRNANDDYEKTSNLIVTDPTTSQTTTYNECYRLVGAGTIIEGNENLLGNIDYCFEIESTSGKVTGKVIMNTKEPAYLTGVKVSLVDKNTKEVITFVYTDSEGYELSYYTGTYDLLFELSGYESVTNEVTITEAGVKMPDIIMKENQSYFGLDLAHALMILGGAAAVILLLFTIFVRIRLAKK